MISSDQIRAARALLRLDQGAVARSAGVSIPTLKRAEGAGKIKVPEKTITAIQTALETAGVEFISENGGGAGVRLRKKKQDGT